MWVLWLWHAGANSSTCSGDVRDEQSTWLWAKSSTDGINTSWKCWEQSVKSFLPLPRACKMSQKTCYAYLSYNYKCYCFQVTALLMWKTLSHPQGVHLVTKQLWFTPNICWCTSQSHQANIYTHSMLYICTHTVYTIYTHTFDHVRENMIILLHTILYFISPKFSTVTDSYVFSVKWGL